MARRSRDGGIVGIGKAQEAVGCVDKAQATPALRYHHNPSVSFADSSLYTREPWLRGKNPPRPNTLRIQGSLLDARQESPAPERFPLPLKGILVYRKEAYQPVPLVHGQARYKGVLNLA